REEKVNGLPGLVHRSIHIPPLAFDPNVSLVHAPVAPDRALAAVECLCQLRTVLHDPALDGCMVEQHPALFHEFLHMPIAQRVRHIPPYTHQNDLLREMGPFEAHRHRLSPSHGTLDDSRRSYRKSPQRKIATEPPMFAIGMKSAAMPHWAGNPPPLGYRSRTGVRCLLCLTVWRALPVILSA